MRHLADLLRQRIAITMAGLLAPSAIEETAEIVAKVLGWSKSQTAAETALSATELAKRSVANVSSAAKVRSSWQLRPRRADSIICSPVSVTGEKRLKELTHAKGYELLVNDCPAQACNKFKTKAAPKEP